MASRMESGRHARPPWCARRAPGTRRAICTASGAWWSGTTAIGPRGTFSRGELVAGTYPHADGHVKRGLFSGGQFAEGELRFPGGPIVLGRFGPDHATGLPGPVGGARSWSGTGSGTRESTARPGARSVSGAGPPPKGPGSRAGS